MDRVGVAVLVAMAAATAAGVGIYYATRPKAGSTLPPPKPEGGTPTPPAPPACNGTPLQPFLNVTISASQSGQANLCAPSGGKVTGVSIVNVQAPISTQPGYAIGGTSNPSGVTFFATPSTTIGLATFFVAWTDGSGASQSGLVNVAVAA